MGNNLNQDKKIMNIMEAILFAVGEAVELDTFVNTIGISKEETMLLLDKLKDEYDYNMRGIKLIQADDTYKLISRNDYFDYIKEVLTNYTTTTLSQAALETLAIVAYKQPVTRVDIEMVRGVKSSSSLDLLVDKGLVECIGRNENILGKPMCFGTTKEFLRLAGIKNIDELPSFEEFIDDIQSQIEYINEMPEAEGQIKIDVE